MGKGTHFQQTNSQLVGGTGQNTVNNQMASLKSVFKGLTLLQDCKTASFDLHTNNEDKVYALAKVLGFLKQSNLLINKSLRKIMKTNDLNVAHQLNIIQNNQSLSTEKISNTIMTAQ